MGFYEKLGLGAIFFALVVVSYSTFEVATTPRINIGQNFAKGRRTSDSLMQIIQERKQTFDNLYQSYLQDKKQSWPKIHIVQEGEYGSGIAEHYLLEIDRNSGIYKFWDKIVKENGLEGDVDGDGIIEGNLKPGDILWLPEPPKEN